MVALANTITRRQRDLILPKNVWGVYDTRYADQRGVCEAYMAEWGIPLSNLIGVDGQLRTEATFWSSVGATVAEAIPSNCQGIFCSPSMNKSALTWNGVEISYARMLGNILITDKILNHLGYSDITSLTWMEQALLQYTPHPSFTSGFASLDVEDSWSRKIVTVGGSTSGSEGAYFGTKVSADGDTYYNNYLPETLELGGLSLSSYTGDWGDANPILPEMLDVECHVADFNLGRNLGNRKHWDVIPSWRLGWADSRADSRLTGISAFTAEDATALAARSKATRTSIGQRKELSSVIGINEGPVSDYWLGSGYWCAFDRLLLDLGFNESKIKMGYYSTYSGLNGATSGSVPEVTGYTRYDFDNMHYRYDVGEANRVLPINGETLPFDVDNFFYDGINRNTGYDTSVPSPTYFEEGHEDQVYSIKDGAVGYSTPSYSNCQGGFFIQAGGSAYHGSYLEPTADDSSNNANSFFFNLLRGHQAATAAMMSSGLILSEEELIGDGLAQPFAEQATAFPRGGGFYHAEVNTDKVDKRKKKYNWLKS